LLVCIGAGTSRVADLSKGWRFICLPSL